MESQKTLFAALTAVAMSIPALAQAEDGAKIDLSPDTPAEQLVEWKGAESPNLIDIRIDKTRRNLHVKTTTNAPVSLHGACPPQDLYPNWKLDLGKKGTATGYPAEVHDRDTIRTGPNGTWTLDTTAPSRPNQTLQTTLTCYRDADGNGTRGEKEDSHSLTAYITSQGSDSGSAAADSSFFTYSGEGPGSTDDTDSSEGHRVKMEVSVLGITPLQGVPEDENMWNPGAGARLSFDPVNSTRDGVKRFVLGLDYRFGHGIPNGTVPDANTHTITGRFGWDPVLSDEKARVVLDVGIGAGVGVTQASILKSGKEIPGSTNVVGTADIGLEVGGNNVRAKIGAFCTLSADPAQQACGVNAGPVIEF